MEKKINVDVNELKDKSKGFIHEFKEFVSRGNVMDMAVGVIIGAAFSDVVTALTKDIINPLINGIGGAEVGGSIKFMVVKEYFMEILLHQLLISL